MKIFSAGVYSGSPIDGDELISDGFVRNGHEVYKFNFRAVASENTPKVMNDMLCDMVPDYDMMVIGKGDKIRPDTIRTIKNKNKNIVVCVWYGDQRENLTQFIVDLSKEADWLWHTTAGSRLMEYKKAGANNCVFFFVPPNPDILNPDGNVYQRDVLFTGTDYGFAEKERKDTIKFLQTLKNCDVYGHRPMPIVKGMDYVNIIKSSKISVSINGFNNFKYYNSERLMNYLSCGTMVLSKYVPNMDDIFEDRKHLVYFDSVNDCREKIQYYLSNDGERERIASSGAKIMAEKYNSKNIIKSLMNVIEHKPPIFEWMEAI